MPSDTKNILERGFRSEWMGFNKNDVLAYMNALADESQQRKMEYEQKLHKLESELESLRRERTDSDSHIAALQAEVDAANQRADAAESKCREGEDQLAVLQRQVDTYQSGQQESQKNANIWQLKCHDLQQQVEDLQKQLSAARQGGSAAPAPDAIREARLEARKILADAQLYAESAEKELKQQAETQKTRMAENARGIAAGVMLVRDRLARVDQRLSAATLDLDGLTQAIYQALDDTEAELRELGTEMRDFAQGTPEASAPEPAPAAKPAAPQFRVKATAQPVRPRSSSPQPKPPAGGRRLRNVRHPVSQMLRDEIDKIDSQTKKSSS
ncbi:MAG TPA: hypothetical protein H9724_02255 [Candidatus Gemmiger avistercoris]|uniref:DivIVA protein n=1 Tax=Candidatus Gemmiger avistercoris TaxID=2838606 RepID=A0A9D2FJA2_9FIRM|nr:hypothetical protein [uncultured Subdoligranulum sp.]HIZ61577.1 hypothetical protein [Candidatus Gemmiger avistercoris]